MQAEAERLRAEVRAKIASKLRDIVKREEENARKLPEEDHPVDEEWVQNLMSKIEGDVKNALDAKNESPGKTEGEAADEDAKEKGDDGEDEEGEDGEDEQEEEDEESSAMEVEDIRPKKQKTIGMMGAAKLLMQQT